MNKILSFLVIGLVLFSCKSPVDKLLRSNDVKLKEEKAHEYFEDGDYVNASPLFKDLIQSFGSSSKVEMVYFYYSLCDYKLEDYLLAAYEFNKIIKKFPRGAFTERAQFLLADCYFQSTPKYNLDQQYNLRAVEEFQLFLEKYPSSEKVKEANDKIAQLYSRREKKAFENAKLFFNTEDYRSAVTAFQQVLNDFPDTEKDEELKFLMVESAFLFAQKSIESKKAQRYVEVEKHVQEFLTGYGDKKESKYLKKVLSYQKKAAEQAKLLEYSLPQYYARKKKYKEAIGLWKKILIKEKDQLKLEEVANLLLTAEYEKAIGAENKNKKQFVSQFLNSYQNHKNQLAVKDTAKWSSKNNYFEELSKKLPQELPYKFLEEGDYLLAAIYFQALIDTADLTKENSQKDFYYGLVSRHKYAKKVNEVIAKNHWDTIVSLTSAQQKWKELKYAGKINSLLIEVKAELKEYPIVLVTKSMDRKNYGVAISKAEEIIRSKNKEVDQQEVVYLLLLSSLKRAKSVKRYERLPQYEFAKAKFDEYSGRITDTVLKEKLAKIEEKINKGLTKYLNKS